MTRWTRSLVLRGPVGRDGPPPPKNPPPPNSWLKRSCVRVSTRGKIPGGCTPDVPVGPCLPCLHSRSAQPLPAHRIDPAFVGRKAPRNCMHASSATRAMRIRRHNTYACVTSLKSSGSPPLSGCSRRALRSPLARCWRSPGGVDTRTFYGRPFSVRIQTHLARPQEGRNIS